MLKKVLTLLALLGATTLSLAAIDVNKATEPQLDSVKGLGPATTQLILEQRKAAPFKNWDDLIDRVKGIGPARAARLSADGLTVGGEAFKGGMTKVKAEIPAVKK